MYMYMVCPYDIHIYLYNNIFILSAINIFFLFCLNQVIFILQTR